MRSIPFGALACALFTLPAYAQGVTPLKANPNVVDWALDAKTGRVFAADYEAGKVHELSPKSGSITRSFTTGQKPTRLVVKGKFLAVTNQDSMTLTVIDLGANRVKGHVSLKARGPYNLFASRQAEHPYVYVIGSESHRGVLLQVDVQRRRIVHRIMPTGYRVSAGRTQAAFSADGRRILMSDGGDMNILQAREGAKTVFTHTARAYVRSNNSGNAIDAGWHGRYWVRGSQLFTDAVKKPVRSFTGSPVALHPKLDLAFSVTQKDRWRPGASTLNVQRFGSAVSVKTVPLTGDPGRRRRHTAGSRFRNAPRLQVDAQRQRLLYAWGEQACVVDLRKLSLPDAPLVLLDVPVSSTVALGERLRVPVKLTNSTLTPTFKLGSAPKGLSLSNNQLTWTPTSSDVGLHTFELTASVGQAKDVASLTIQVTRPQVELPITIKHLAIDPAGKYAVASNVGERNRRTSKPVPTQLVLIDLTQRAIVATRTLSKAIAAVHVDETGVYVGASAGNAFYALKLGDLSDRKRAFVDKGPVQGFVRLPGGKLGVQASGRTLAYDATSLRKVGARDASPPDRFSHRMNRRLTGYGPLSDGTLIGGRVVDAKGKTQMVVGHPGYGVPMVAGGMRGNGLPCLWNRQVVGNRLNDAKGQQIAVFNRNGSSWSGTAERLLREVPAAGRLLVVSQRNSTQQTLKLEYRDLIEGSVKLTQTLAVFQRRGSSGYDSPRPHLAQVAGRVVAAYDRTLYVLPLPTRKLGNLPYPVEFAYRVERQTLTHKERLKATLGGVGGAGGYTFELTQAMKGLTLTKAGALTIDGPELWANYLKSVSESMRRYRGGENSWTRTAALKRSRARYQELFGQATTEFPLFLPVSVAVSDSEGQRADLTLMFALTGPLVDVTEIKPSKAVARAPRRAGRFGAPEPAPQPAAGNANAEEVTDLGLRLNRAERALRELQALEQKVTELEAQVQPADAPDLALNEKSIQELESKLTAANERIEELEGQAAVGLTGAILGAAGLIAAIIAVLLGRLGGAQAPLPAPMPPLPSEPAPEPAPAVKRRRPRAESGSGEAPVRKKKRKKKKKKVRPPEDLVGAGSGRLDIAD